MAPREYASTVEVHGILYPVTQTEHVPEFTELPPRPAVAAVQTEKKTDPVQAKPAEQAQLANVSVQRPADRVTNPPEEPAKPIAALPAVPIALPAPPPPALVAVALPEVGRTEISKPKPPEPAKVPVVAAEIIPLPEEPAERKVETPVAQPPKIAKLNAVAPTSAADNKSANDSKDSDDTADQSKKPKLADKTAKTSEKTVKVVSAAKKNAPKIEAPSSDMNSDNEPEPATKKTKLVPASDKQKSIADKSDKTEKVEKTEKPVDKPVAAKKPARKEKAADQGTAKTEIAAKKSDKETEKVVDSADATPAKDGIKIKHLIAPNETLSGIAMKYYGHCGAKVIARILAANKGLDPNKIKAGQELVIPPKES